MNYITLFIVLYVAVAVKFDLNGFVRAVRTKKSNHHRAHYCTYALQTLFVRIDQEFRVY